MDIISNIEFFEQDTVSLAQNLIGKWIETNINGKKRIAQISETEAYLGINDSACHTYQGKRTQKTEPMWQNGGTIYVYLCYGIHNLFNIVSKKENEPEAVLIRATVQANGPGKLTKHLGIDKVLNSQSIINNPQIKILDDKKDYSFKTAKRVGIDYALKKDIDAKLRFILVWVRFLSRKLSKTQIQKCFYP